MDRATHQNWDDKAMIFENDPPPCGTACTLCKTEGHFCPAKGYIETLPVCRECGEGKPCSQQIAIAKLHTTPAEFGEMIKATPLPNERRCADCRGLLSSQTKGTLCWPCKKRIRQLEANHRRDRANAKHILIGV
jgi:hypothetical protein